MVATNAHGCAIQENQDWMHFLMSFILGKCGQPRVHVLLDGYTYTQILMPKRSTLILYFLDQKPRLVNILFCRKRRPLFERDRWTEVFVLPSILLPSFSRYYFNCVMFSYYIVILFFYHLRGE